MKPITNRTTAASGFTLIELLLAMAFFGSVLVIATLLLTQTLNIYNRGMTVKQMNQATRTFIEELSRVSNSGEVVSLGHDSGGRVNCISIDKTIYLWNVADPQLDNTTDGYKTPKYYYDDGTPVNFIKLTNQDRDCLTTAATVPHSEASQVIGDTIRAYTIDITEVTANLVRVSVLFGTFDIVGSDYNLIDNGGNLECKPGSVGNFCAKAALDTILYIPNGGFGT